MTDVRWSFVQCLWDAERQNTKWLKAKKTAKDFYTNQDIINYIKYELNLILGQETISKTQCDER